MPETDQEPVLDEFFLLWVLLAQTTDAVSRLRERDYAHYGLNNERRAILYILHNNGGRAKPVDIARELFRELHSVTEMMKRMEEAGLVPAAQGHGPVEGRSETRPTWSAKCWRSRTTSEPDKKIFSTLTKSERERLRSRSGRSGRRSSRTWASRSGSSTCRCTVQA